LKNFCGTAADAVTSKSNILHIRYFAEHNAINSQFGMIYTAFRDKDKDGEFNLCFSISSLDYTSNTLNYQ
jgi:hypothetical protein